MIAPRYSLAPKGTSREVYLECVGLAESAGLILDDWQAHALELGLRTRGSGRKRRWASFRVGVNVARQNGKGGILEARKLLGLFGETVKDELTIYSAHQFDTSMEAFTRLENLIDSSDDLRRRVRKIVRSHGEEGIHLRNGRRIRYRTRTKGGARGFSCDCLLLDEAMILPEVAHGALLPTLSARRNPQVWYAGSAVDQLVHEHGIVWARVRKGGLEGDPGLVYLEWSANAEIDELDSVLDDRKAWRDANPALELRIAESHVEHERRAMDSRAFGVERLGVGDWPPVDLIDRHAIDFELWQSLQDDESALPEGPYVFAFDVTPDRSRATICVAGRRSDGRFHVEVESARRGTGWLPLRLAELAERWQPEAILYDGASPATALEKPLEQYGLPLERTSAHEYAAACGLFFDLVEQGSLRHLGQVELNAAVRNASKRPLGESWAWSRRLSAGDISPLVAGTLALWRAHASSESVYESRGLVAV